MSHIFQDGTIEEMLIVGGLWPLTLVVFVFMAITGNFSNNNNKIPQVENPLQPKYKMTDYKNALFIALEYIKTKDSMAMIVADHIVAPKIDIIIALINDNGIYKIINVGHTFGQIAILDDAIDALPQEIVVPYLFAGTDNE